MIRNYIIIIVFFLCNVSLQSQIPAGYYSTAAGLSGDELKTALYKIIKGHTEYPYTSSSGTDVWDILKETDKDTANSDNVILLYSGWSVNAAQEYNSGNGWTREHVWAKSRGDFGTDPGPGTDVHHLRPEDNNVNSARNNRWFDNCSEEYLCSGTLYTGCYTSSTSYVWEPRAIVKGDVARMIFYMATRYEGENGEPDLEVIDYFPADDETKEPVFAKLSALLEWNEEDPVDDWESNRNNVIYSYQHNRNPFIDHPEYVNMIWDVTSNIEKTENKSKIILYPNPARSYVQIKNPEQYSVTIYSALGVVLTRTEESYIKLDNLNTGYYLVIISDASGRVIDRQKLIVW